MIAELSRHPSRHTTTAILEDGMELTMAPASWGAIVAATREGPVATIERRSWWGRRWEIGGSGFGCEVTSDPLPRRWTLRIGGEPMGRIAGSAFSYNKMVADLDVTVPVHALILAWHVLVRPWEAAAAPRTLVPEQGPA